MATVKVLVIGSSAMPITDEPIIMCPVEDTGRNSVIPSMMAKMIACSVFIKIFRSVFNLLRSQQWLILQGHSQALPLLELLLIVVYQKWQD